MKTTGWELSMGFLLSRGAHNFLLIEGPGVTDDAWGRQNLVHGGSRRRRADCLIVADESCLTAWRGLSFAGATCFVCPDTACADWLCAVWVCAAPSCGATA
ncbi:hypothetical protein TcCL_ESM05862 [Trypanosoma cruzi]|nr:hypothetical protein TcCL_ESM05862 [Trypanosoma cruzi]